MPPELLRKGRFDEIFFVDLPTFEERKEIFKVHLSKRLKDKEVCKEVKINNELLDSLSRKTEGFIGSEIEQVVVSALCDAFFEERALKLTDFDRAIENTVPLSKTQKEQIVAIREWANVRAVCASSKTSTKEYFKNENSVEKDVTTYRGGRQLDL